MSFQYDALGAYIYKSPTADLDYSVDWSALGWLQTGETITASSWLVTGPDTSLVASDAGSASGVATCWLINGTMPQTYLVTNTITTSAGRTDSRSFRVMIRNV